MSKSSLRLNIVANFVGRFWGTLIGILFVPVYIRYIGIEAYGLLGVFNTIQAILGLLDMGLSTTLNREVAKHTALDGSKQYINNLVFTMERFYLIIALLTGIALVIASWFFATKWVNPEKLDAHTIVVAFMLMAVNFALQFPGSLYQGGLMGLQRQVTLNIIISSISTAKAIGAILILWLVSPTITAFLTWQVILSVVQFFVLRYFLYRNLPPPDARPHFDKAVIRNSGRYAAGIMGISALSIVLTQSDKVILSKLVSLSEFGYYALASTVAAALGMVLYPITTAVFPKMTELVSTQKKDQIINLFHTSCQLVSLIIIPMGLSLFIFSSDIILAWTRSPVIAANAAPILRFLVLGTTLNCLMLVPYQYTLSIGWIRFGINTNLTAILVFLPAIFVAVNYRGAVGGAFIWMILNCCYMIFAMLYLFAKHLQAERWKWYFTDVLKPIVVCVLIATPFYFLRQHLVMTRFLSIGLFAVCLAICYSVTLWWGTPAIKPEVNRFITRIRGRKAVNI